jgi:hypothetical protein
MHCSNRAERQRELGGPWRYSTLLSLETKEYVIFSLLANSLEKLVLTGPSYKAQLQEGTVAAFNEKIKHNWVLRTLWIGMSHQRLDAAPTELFPKLLKP